MGKVFLLILLYFFTKNIWAIQVFQQKEIQNKYSNTLKQDRLLQLYTPIKQHDNIWKCIGPGFSNVISHVLIHKQTITILIDIGGLIESRDSGRTWNYLTHYSNKGITSRRFYDFDISPNNPNFMLIAGDGIFKTVNHGKNWEKVIKGLPTSKFGTRINAYSQIKFNKDGSRILAGTGTKSFMPIKHIEKVLLNNHSNKSILISKDNAQSFSNLIIDNDNSAILKKIYPHPVNSNIVYLSFSDGTFYLCRNIKDPINKIKFYEVTLPVNFFVRDILISKKKSSVMYLTLSSMKKNIKSKLMISKNCLNPNMTLKKINFKISLELLKNIYKGFTDFTTLNFDSKLEEFLIIGSNKDQKIFKYNLKDKTISSVLLNKKKHDLGLGHFYRSIERTFKGDSNISVVVSKIGSWVSYDNFKTFESLLMNYKDGYFWNKGVSAIGNVNTLNITSKYIYAGTHDHSSWQIDNLNKSLHLKSKVPPSLRLEKFSRLGTHIYASEDDQYIIMEDNARFKKYKGHHMNQDKKFFLSIDEGKSWKDITKNFGKGDIFPGGSNLVKILFHPKSSKKQWWLFSNKLYFTKDAGKSFILQNEIPQTIFPKIKYTDIAYNHKHNILYLSSSILDSKIDYKPNYIKGTASLLMSTNNGLEWKAYDIQQNAIKSLAVTDNGTLAIGTMKSKQQPGRLIIIPYGERFNVTHIKMELGKKKEELYSNQVSFWPIVTDGNNILVYSNINWLLNDDFYAQGPLLSTDSGKTFQWIIYNLPNTNIYSMAMKDGVILLGTTLGIMKTDINQLTQYIKKGN